MAGYVFISNSSKPSEAEQMSRERVELSNVSRPCLTAALDMGYDVYFGTNRENPEGLECELPIHLYDSHTYRSITAFKDNKIAYKNLKEVIKKSNAEVIHCNTPVGGMIGRICGKLNKVKYIIYTAHGFHFYEGAPLFNNTILKWAEMFMARFTDAIITMNSEDYEAAKKFRLKKGGRVYFIEGVGINTEDYFNLNADREKKRRELSLENDDIICISMGDLIKRKNYETVLRAFSRLNNKKIHYLICGTGPEEDNLKSLAKQLNIESNVHFLGFRRDIKELLKASDIFVFSTFQEGMPRSMMEAMASGLPCIASRVRGNIDLICDLEGGYLLSANDDKAFAEKIEYLSENPGLREEMSRANIERIKKYDVKIVSEKISKIYKEVLN